LTRKRLRRPLRLHPHGSFTFTPKTVSIDVSAVAPGPGARKILHVSRSRGALEIFGPDEPAREVDLVRAVSLLELEAARRREAGEPGIETLFDPRLLLDIRRLARTLVRATPTTLPFEGRPRSCFETMGPHPGESLWIARDKPEAVIETRAPVFDEAGEPAGTASTFRPVSMEEGLVWLLAESHGLAGALLGLARQGGSDNDRGDSPGAGPPARGRR
jgi:hypothetical protein